MTRVAHSLTTAALCAALAGCAQQPAASTSHIQGAAFRDASALTVYIADILANSMDARRSTIQLLPYDGPDPDHTRILLTDTLRERGFAITPEGMAYPGAHTLRYAVNPVGQDLVLELDVDDAQATCLYGHASEGALQRRGSCTLRNGAQLSLRIPSGGPVLQPAPAPAGQTGAGPSASTPVSTPAAPPLAETWTLIEGQSVRDQMIAWGDRAGWRVIWPRDLNWMIPAMTSFTGDYQKVMTDIIRTISDEGKSIRAEFHAPNRTLVVTNPGGHDQ